MPDVSGGAVSDARCVICGPLPDLDPGEIDAHLAGPGHLAMVELSYDLRASICLLPPRDRG